MPNREVEGATSVTRGALLALSSLATLFDEARERSVADHRASTSCSATQASMAKVTVGAVLFLAVIGVSDARNNTLQVKCCSHSHVLSDNLRECELWIGDTQRYGIDVLRDAINDTLDNTATCFEGIETSSAASVTSNSVASITFCIDFLKNGSLASANCSNIFRNSASDKCDSIFTPLHIYGATMLIFANIVYLFLYLSVVFMYVFMPHLCRRAYDKAVLSFAVTQATLSVVIITLGYHLLCRIKLNRYIYSLFGVGIMTFVTSGVLWLLIISVDVASTITRLRWAPSSGAKGRDENHKFRVYLSWVLLGTLVPTTISTIFEFSPLPDESIVKPQFYVTSTVNYRVIVHVISTPIFVAIASNALFLYTTVRMIMIRRSTNVVNENRKKSVTEKYILYLKLYLLMDAPYITGALGSIYEDLWILKFCRLLQPVLMLYAVIPRKTGINCILCRNKCRETPKQALPKNQKNYEPC